MAETQIRRRRRNPKAAYAMEFIAQEKQVLFEVFAPEGQILVRGSIRDGRKPLAKIDLWCGQDFLAAASPDDAFWLSFVEQLEKMLPTVRGALTQSIEGAQREVAARATFQAARAASQTPSPLARDYAVSAALRDREQFCWARAKPVHDKLLADGATQEDAIAAADQELLRAMREWDAANHEAAVAITRWLVDASDAQHGSGA